MSDKISILITKQIDLTHSTGTAVMQRAGMIQLLISVFVVLGVLFGFFITRSVGSTIIDKVQSAADAMEDIAERGNLMQHIDESGRGELARLGNGFNLFI